MLRCFGHVWLCVTLWTVAHQAPLSMGFPRQKYWSGLPCPPPKDLPSSGIKLASPMSPALAGKFFTTITNLGSPRYVRFSVHWYFNKATSKKGNPVFAFIDRNLLYCIHTHTHTHAHLLPPLPCFCTFFLQVDNASSAGSCLWTPTHQKKKKKKKWLLPATVPHFLGATAVPMPVINQVCCLLTFESILNEQPAPGTPQTRVALLVLLFCNLACDDRCWEQSHPCGNQQGEAKS